MQKPFPSSSFTRTNCSPHREHRGFFSVCLAFAAAAASGANVLPHAAQYPPCPLCACFLRVPSRFKHFGFLQRPDAPGMGRAQARERADAAEDKLLLLSDALSLVRIEPKRLRRIPLVRLTGNWRDYGELTLAYAELTRTYAGALIPNLWKNTRVFPVWTARCPNVVFPCLDRPSAIGLAAFFGLFCGHCGPSPPTV